MHASHALHFGNHLGSGLLGDSNRAVHRHVEQNAANVFFNITQIDPMDKSTAFPRLANQRAVSDVAPRKLSAYTPPP